MNNDYAKLFNSIDHVFISDIRSNTVDQDYPLDIDIFLNTSMMYNWMNILKPYYSMLKIRMPYGTDSNTDTKMYEDEFKLSKKYGIDFLSDYKINKFKMSKSELYIQAWAGRSSSELRMYIKKDDINKIIDYNVDEIEGKMFYFNNISRNWHLHINSNSSKKYNFCHCNDCALENLIWTDYLKKNKSFVKNIYEAINIANNITHRTLVSHHHGTIWEPYINNIELFQKIYNDTFAHINKNINKNMLSKSSRKKMLKQRGNKGKN